MSVLLELAPTLSTVLVPMNVDVTPNDDGLPGIAALRNIVGAVMTIALILSVLALLISAIVWGFGSNSSNPHLASRGKVGVLVSCAAAVITGAAVTLINFFWNVGQTVS
ncbi:hypothetical protein GNZ21_01615 [Nesterenkonia alkaliphila]|uniref:Integral membrane protein n=2 Tax=Nesterenkonia alkaliphila TaxID=1463631 RepID=A0A7K1UF70_9MICC|nr:DUF6112 family protein [Nesterenkonia alkaliphila]MVT25072.1 hypothetical protein [Nesterenkonia alkaliphila]GFZ83197.1 hypothetical protein GCM10011359_09890 [Nesterenkonia alkaliphila]